MSIVTKKPTLFFILAFSITSDIYLPLSLICLFLSYVVCVKRFNLAELLSNSQKRAFLIIFRSTFNKEIGLQFFMYLLYVFFSVNLMTACL